MSHQTKNLKKIYKREQICGNHYRDDNEDADRKFQRRKIDEKRYHHHDEYRNRYVGNDQKRQRREEHRQEKQRKSEYEEQSSSSNNRSIDSRQENIQQRPSWENSLVKRQLEKIQERKKLWKGKTQPTETTISNEHFNIEGFASEVTTKDTNALSSTNDFDTNSPSSTNEKKLESKWQSIIMASSKDTQQMDKFQKLMGLKKSSKDSVEQSASKDRQLDDNELERERSRQQHLQNDLSKQFEMARQTHHTARGRGLGSF